MTNTQSIRRTASSSRARCGCGWVGPVRLELATGTYGEYAAAQATADAHTHAEGGCLA